VALIVGITALITIAFTSARDENQSLNAFISLVGIVALIVESAIWIMG
jgi:hypothetical protein